LYVDPGASQLWRGFSYRYAGFWWVGSLVAATVSVAKRERARWLSVALIVLVVLALCCHTCALLLPPI
jgi:hypothetical protein